MVGVTIIFFVTLAVLVAVFSIFSTVIFYHIARFSFIGDKSKRIFLIDVSICALIVIGSIVLMVINHILS